MIERQSVKRSGIRYADPKISESRPPGTGSSQTLRAAPTRLEQPNLSILVRQQQLFLRSLFVNTTSRKPFQPVRKWRLAAILTDRQGPPDLSEISRNRCRQGERSE